jgi:tryptophanyl-tRNA synthetase
MVAEAVVARLEPIQAKYASVTKDPAYIDDVLRRGVEHTMPIARATIETVKRAMGLYVPDGKSRA